MCKMISNQNLKMKSNQNKDAYYIFSLYLSGDTYLWMNSNVAAASMYRVFNVEIKINPINIPMTVGKFVMSINGQHESSARQCRIT